MPKSLMFSRILLFILPLHCITGETLQVVLQNGRAIPVSSLSLKADNLIIGTASEGFKVGQSFPLTMADHVYGDKPAQINQAIALTLTGKSKKAQELLLPILKEHALTAKIPGNFWLDASRTLLVAYSLNGDEADAVSIGKEIADATPAQGIDPFVLLSKALLTIDIQERQSALRDLTADNMPDDVRAYASYFRGNIFIEQKKKTEALEAYLAVPCLYSSGGLILNASAELMASDLLAELKRRDEALALVRSALRASAGTVLESQATTRLESFK